MSLWEKKIWILNGLLFKGLLFLSQLETANMNLVDLKPQDIVAPPKVGVVVFLGRAIISPGQKKIVAANIRNTMIIWVFDDHLHQGFGGFGGEPHSSF